MRRALTRLAELLRPWRSAIALILIFALPTERLMYVLTDDPALSAGGAASAIALGILVTFAVTWVHDRQLETKIANLRRRPYSDEQRAQVVEALTRLPVEEIEKALRTLATDERVAGLAIRQILELETPLSLRIDRAIDVVAESRPGAGE